MKRYSFLFHLQKRKRGVQKVQWNFRHHRYKQFKLRFWVYKNAHMMFNLLSEGILSDSIQRMGKLKLDIPHVNSLQYLLHHIMVSG
jgi:hypothetical protein